MDVLKSIYDAKVIDTNYDNSLTIVTIAYNTNYYAGAAQCCPEDKDFYSKKVGYNIALSRARLNLYNDLIASNELKYKELKKYYYSVIGIKNPAEVDPTGSFKRILDRLETKVKYLRWGRRIEKRNLHNYLEGQKKAVESIRRFREKNKDNVN